MTQLKLKKDIALRQKLNELFSLRVALSNCIFINEESIEKSSIDIPFTKLGEKLYKFLTRKLNTINPNLIKLAIFIDFYQEDFYIKVSEIDIENLEKQVSKWIINDSIRYPWIYGRDLYDKYFTKFESQEQDLDYEDTLQLLDNTLKGVFQINEKIIGPFGIIRSKVKRKIIPKIEMQLWHCSDPSCGSFHITKFNNSEDSKIISILNELSLININKSALDLNEFIDDIDDNDYFEPNNLCGIYEFLANSFGADEHRSILQRIIEKEDIRSLLPTNLKKGSASDLVKKLGKDECFNLLLITEDITLLKHIEALIEENIIVIPNTEIRESNIKKGFGQYDTFIQCNKLGIRVNSLHTELSLTRLKKLIKDVNSESPYREQLEWKLKNFDSSSNLDQKISDYIYIQTPLTAIRETIYNGPVQLEKTFASLSGIFTIPNNQETETKLIEKIAWKLGFNINLFPTFIDDFWINLTTFKADVLTSSKYNESDKAKIRSSAVNLFVSMEDILQQSLSFITWALLSDHYIETKFSYVYEDARQFMISKLDNFEYSKNEFLKFDKLGKNTLFPLVSGYNALIKICDEIIINAEKYKRPENEFPSFYNNDPLKMFPFEHKLFLLDIKATDYKALKEFIGSIPSEFSRGKIMDIRNRLQHKRDDFPSQHEMLDTITSIEKSFSLLENQGLYPNVYLFEKSTTDEFNRTKISVMNYKRKSVSFYITPELDGTLIPSALQPIVVINNLQFGLTNHPVVFRYKEKSSYQTYWKDFPKKKR